jgi:hypothetical protein
MDLRAILSRKLDQLPEGAHTNGLRAVMSHVDSAIRHLERGQREPDETLFTDVVFRCNQGFEGSIKEAYRVLAGQDPDRKSIHDIELFLEQGNHFRRKVLDQFKRYRQEWRNPSTHDYTLDFDEDEALLAIVSVAAFAIVLCDQIAAELVFALAAAQPALISAEDQRRPLLELVEDRALSFVNSHEEPAAASTDDNRSPMRRAFEFEGALGGFLAAELSADEGVVVQTGVMVTTGTATRRLEADIVVTRGTERVVLELKRSQSRSVRNAKDAALGQVLHFLQVPDVTGAVVVVYSGSGVAYSAIPADAPLDERVRIVSQTPS